MRQKIKTQRVYNEELGCYELTEVETEKYVFDETDKMAIAREYHEQRIPASEIVARYHLSSKMKLQILATQMEYPFHQVIMPFPDKDNRLAHGDSIAIEKTEGCGWTVPVGTDTNDFWTPIKCCSKGFGFKVYKSNLKGFVAPFPCIDYHPMAEQEAWKYVNKKLLAKEI